MVVDSNFLKEDELVHFLSYSKAHRVVVTDYLMMEAYKSGDVAHFLELMAALCAFKEQVIILKSTTAISRLRGRPAGLIRRMIEPDSAGIMTDFCDKIGRAKEGARLTASFSGHQEAAEKHMSRLLEDAKGLIASFSEIVGYFSKQEMEQFRRGDKLSKALALKTMELAEELTFRLLRGANYPGKINVGEFVNLYVFRFALCGALLVLKWIRNGETGQRNPEKLRNDLIDVCICTYATYFRGPLTNDEALKAMYCEASAILGLVGGSIDN